MSVVVRWVHAGLLDEARRVAARAVENAKTTIAPNDPARGIAQFASGVVADLEQVDLAPFATVESFVAQAERYLRSKPFDPTLGEPTKPREELLAVVERLRAATIRPKSVLETTMGFERERLVHASSVELTVQTVLERDDWRRIAKEPPSEVVSLVGTTLWHLRAQDARRFDLAVTDADAILGLARAAAGVRGSSAADTSVERPVTHLRLFVEDGFDGSIVATTMAIDHYAPITPLLDPWRSFLSVLVLGLDPPTESEIWSNVRKRLAMRPPETERRGSRPSGG